MNRFFDQAAFDTLGAEIGEADAREVLRAFLEDTAIRMTRLAASGEVRPLIKREAHSLKSSAATFGFHQLSRLAMELESGADTISLATLRASVASLQQAFEVARQFALANLLAARAGLPT
jgi:HPt (histidine-containing phosphotransfer) domain-containing protein